MEINFLLFIQDHIRNAFFTPIMKFFTILGEKGWFFILLSFLLLFIGVYYKKRPYKIAGLTCTISLIVDVILCNGILKNLFNRTRPYVVNSALQVLGPVPGGKSFPSGHTAAAFAFAFAIALTLPSKYKKVALTIAILCAISRLYLGAHYPTDVIGGAIVGTACAFIAQKLTSIFIAYASKKGYKI